MFKLYVVTSDISEGELPTRELCIVPGEPHSNQGRIWAYLDKCDADAAMVCLNAPMHKLFPGREDMLFSVKEFEIGGGISRNGNTLSKT